MELQLARLQNLIDRYKTLFQVPEDEVSLLESQVRDREDLWSRKNFRGHLTASGFVFARNYQELLLVHHRRLDRWLQPGGHVDPGEDLIACAKREIQEETGLARFEPLPFHQLTDLPCDINSHPIPANPRKNEAAHIHHDFRFIFNVRGETDLRHDDAEVLDARWVNWDDLSREVLGEKTRSRIIRVVNQYLGEDHR